MLARRALQERWLLPWRSKQPLVVGCKSLAVARANEVSRPMKHGVAKEGTREGGSKKAREGRVDGRSERSMNDPLPLSLGGDCHCRVTSGLGLTGYTLGWWLGGDERQRGDERGAMSKDEYRRTHTTGSVSDQARRGGGGRGCW